MIETREKVGEIQITSGEIIVTDPCYKPGVWGQAKVKARNGKYNVFLEKRDSRNTVLVARHEDFSKTPKAYEEKVLDFFTVDSGLVGLFDAEAYKQIISKDYPGNKAELIRKHAAIVRAGDMDGIHDGIVLLNEEKEAELIEITL